MTEARPQWGCLQTVSETAPHLPLLMTSSCWCLLLYTWLMTTNMPTYTLLAEFDMDFSSWIHMELQIYYPFVCTCTKSLSTHTHHMTHWGQRETLSRVFFPLNNEDSLLHSTLQLWLPSSSNRYNSPALPHFIFGSCHTPNTLMRYDFITAQARGMRKSPRVFSLQALPCLVVDLYPAILHNSIAYMSVDCR